MSKIITDDPELRRLHDDIDGDVKRDGRSVMCIGGEEDSPPFCYTIGNALVGLPELLMIGSIKEQDANLLNRLSLKMLERHAAFDDGELVDAGTVLPLKVINADKRAHDEYTIQAGQHLGHENYVVQQVLIPDKSGRYPDDPECAAPYAAMPVLKATAH